MQSLTAAADRIQTYFAELNLFEDERTRFDQFYLRTAIISSRVYIALLTLAVIIVIVFTSLDTQSEVITIRNPSQAYYQALINNNSTQLSCPCSHITIPYGNFSSTTVNYHPVCSSVFVSDDWINHLFSSDIGKLYQADFRVLASSYFQLLAALCSHANRSVYDALADFDSKTLLTPDVLSQDFFDNHTQAKSKFLKLSTENDLLQLLELIRTTTHANALQTAIQTSTIMNIIGSTIISVDIIFHLNLTLQFVSRMRRVQAVWQSIRIKSLSNVEFTARARQAFNQFILNTVAEVKHSIALIRSQISTMYTTGQSDAFWKLSPWRNSSYSMYFQAAPKQFGNCSCAFTLRDRLHGLWQLIKEKAVELNLFESEISWNDPHRHRKEIISTRIYLFLLVFSVIILVVYTGISVQIQTFIVESPSQSIFEQLISNPKYSSSLDCPCQNISVSYDSFISISLRYHQLCSSDFVVNNSLWIKLVYSGSDLIDHDYDDYPNDTFTNALSIFRSNTYISKRAESRQVVNTQMRAILDQFRLSIPRTFMRRLDFIRQMAQGNGLLSRISSNWYITPLQIDAFGTMAPRSYRTKDCSCGTSALCTSSATIDKWIIPGFLVGCYPLESLLQSTLECLYNLTCINRLKNITKFSNMTFRPLNSTLSSLNVTVQSLVDVLMIDQWESNIIYENYYTICATLSCTYVTTEQVNTIYIVTTIIGLFGGLIIALKVIVPILVTIMQYLSMRRRRRIEPVITVILDAE
ncbi:hypothetical protein I4U23_022526 [Adineta vaga]|nr:hypothetical protein I4U23_022526 [Adineta vaga]